MVPDGGVVKRVYKKETMSVKRGSHLYNHEERVKQNTMYVRKDMVRPRETMSMTPSEVSQRECNFDFLLAKAKGVLEK
eukprot:3086679-Pleurochrysis_carterae.AAC.2